MIRPNVRTQEGRNEHRQRIHYKEGPFLVALDGLDIAEEMAEALRAEGESLAHDADCDDCDRRRDESTDVHASNRCPESLRLGSRAYDLRKAAQVKWAVWKGER